MGRADPGPSRKVESYGFKGFISCFLLDNARPNHAFGVISGGFRQVPAALQNSLPSGSGCTQNGFFVQTLCVPSCGWICPTKIAGDPTQTSAPSWIWEMSLGSLQVAKFFLRNAWAFHHDRGPCNSKPITLLKPPTGEPCAGEPPARFGWRGGEYPSRPNRSMGGGLGQILDTGFLRSDEKYRFCNWL